MTRLPSALCDRQLAGLWRPAIGLARGGEGVPSGHVPLDRVLGEGGWPRAGLVELLLERPGSGELELLLPLLVRLSAPADAAEGEPGWLVWIDPPLLPFAPALQRRGVALSRLLVVQPRPADLLWAAQQAARASCSRVVLCWSRQPLRYPELRKLQVAASDGGQPLFLFRTLRVADQPSPAILRLQLQPQPAGLAVQILKQRGGRHGERCLLPWPALLPSLPHPPRRDDSRYRADLVASAGVARLPERLASRRPA
jgi:cell division inhibitor SulA/protein ImuA